jgi:hypothetical protein
MVWYVDPSASAGAAPLATEATLATLLARATASNANEATSNANTAATAAALQRIIDERKPYQLIQSMDIRSYAVANVTTNEDGKTTVEITNVFEDGNQTSVADVNWGLDNINGTGGSFTYDSVFNGSHTITVLGSNGQTFSRVINHQNRKGINTGTKAFYLTADIYGKVDAQEYLRLTVADASGAVAVGDFDLQLNSYSPILPDTGKNKNFLHKAPESRAYIQARQEEISGGTGYTIPPNRINSFNVWVENVGANFDVSFDGGPFINYNDSRPFGGFTAKEGYLNQRIDIQNNGARIVLATLS